MGLLVLAIVGLVIGILLGLPGRYDQTPEEIERLMAKGGGTRRKREKRTLSPVAWLQRRLSPSGPPPSKRRGFKLEAPGARPEAPSRPTAPTPRERDPDEETEQRAPRTRTNLREGRFKLRPPGEGGRD